MTKEKDEIVETKAVVYAGPGRTAKKGSFKNRKREDEKSLQQQICIIEHHILW